MKRLAKNENDANDAIRKALMIESMEESTDFSLVEAFERAHVVMAWVGGYDLKLRQAIIAAKTATAESIHLLDPLWDLCANTHHIIFTETQKIHLFQDFLDD